MRPRFSIIVPVYNVAYYLRDCLDSVRQQSVTDWECICVDDGSGDGSEGILDEYVARDKRFRVIHQKNAGVGAARNKGLDAARGEWILFLDGDDVWHPELFREVSRMIAEYPGEKLFRFGMEHFEGDSWVGKLATPGTSEWIDISKAISMHDFRDFYFYCYAYKRELLDTIRFPKYIRGEDRCVINRIQLELVDSVVATPGLLYGYRKRMGSAVNSVPSAQVLRDEMDHRLDIMEMIDASHKKVGYADDFWLEQYFTRKFYWIIKSRTTDRKEVVADWRKRLRRLRRVKGLSKYGRVVAWSCSLIRMRAWDTLVCYVIPRLHDGSSPIRWLRRKLSNSR